MTMMERLVAKTAWLVTAALCFPAAVTAQKCDTSAFTYNASTGRYTMPGGINSVTSSSQCSCLQQQWDAIKAQIQAQHEACLQANASAPTNPNNGNTPHSSCSKNGCQGLHDALFTTMAPSEQAQVSSCNQAAAKYQADQERIQLAEEQEQQQQAAQEHAAQQLRSQQLQARKQQLAAVINAKQDAAQRQVAATQQLQQRVAQQQQNDAAVQKSVQDAAAEVEKILAPSAPNSSSMPAPASAAGFGAASDDTTASSSMPTPAPGATPAAPPTSDATMIAASDNSPVPSPAPTPAPNSASSSDVLSAAVPSSSYTSSSQPGSSALDPNDPAAVAKAILSIPATKDGTTVSVNLSAPVPPDPDAVKAAMTAATGQDWDPRNPPSISDAALNSSNPDVQKIVAQYQSLQKTASQIPSPSDLLNQATSDQRDALLSAAGGAVLGTVKFGADSAAEVIGTLPGGQAFPLEYKLATGAAGGISSYMASGDAPSVASAENLKLASDTLSTVGEGVKKVSPQVAGGVLGAGVDGYQAVEAYSQGDVYKMTTLATSATADVAKATAAYVENETLSKGAGSLGAAASIADNAQKYYQTLTDSAASFSSATVTIPQAYANQLANNQKLAAQIAAKQQALYLQLQQMLQDSNSTPPAVIIAPRP